MVDIREIQIGNYFNVPNHQQCPFSVDSIEHFIIDLNTGHQSGKVAAFPIINGKYEYRVHPLTWYTSDLKPIPLTEDILIRCGFERCVYRTVPKSRSIDVIYYKGYGIIVYLIDSGFEIEIGSDNRISTPVLKTFKYLHQLQNLVKLLCNQTIELK